MRPIGPLRAPDWLVRRAAEAGGVSLALARSGVWRSAGPAQLPGIERALRRWGQSMAALGAVAAIRFPDRAGVIDERGPLTYRELDQWVAQLAAGLHAEHGIVAGSKVAVLCRNHRYFLAATLAASRLGADVLFVNTEFAAPQVFAVLEKHRPDLLVHDEEFAVGNDLPTVLGWQEEDTTGGLDALGARGGLDALGVRGGLDALGVRGGLDALGVRGGPEPPAPERPGHITILTSGTTGTPKAAPRAPTALGLAGLTASALERFGLRAGEPMVICPPLFHGFGLLNSMLALFLGSPLVLARRYDAAAVLGSIEATRAGSVVAVPVMLQRMLELDPAEIARYDVRSVRAVISGASALPPSLASRFIAQFGPVLCDAYGSSEIGIATIASSAELLAAPGTVGRPCLGSSVRILGPDDRPVPSGETGRIFAGGGLVFGGYSDGSTKTVVAGRMSTGDLGHLDSRGRLFVDGREDDMIVSGGENVYPVEVEDCLLTHPSVADAAVVGVPDEDYGQRLIAYVVLRSSGLESAGPESSGLDSTGRDSTGPESTGPDSAGPESTGPDSSGVTPDGLLDHVRANLARYKIPRDIVVVDELPRTATGKVVKRDLGTH